MRLHRFEVYGLFGLFDHQFDFNIDERITIIHAPNGYGKTVILKFIEGFFGGSLSVFRQYEYKKIVFGLGELGTVEIEHINIEPELFPREDRKDWGNYSISWINVNEVKTWDPLADRGANADLVRRIPPSTIDRYLPFVSRLSGGWRDHNLGDIVPTSVILERYIDLLPPSMRRHGPHPDWLTQIRSAIRCRLVETQRLMVRRRPTSSLSTNDDIGMTPAVKTYAEEMAAAMGRALEESANLSQSLDSTFPNRLLRRVGSQKRPLSEGHLRQRLSELEQRRTRLSKAGILDKTDEEAIAPGEAFNPQTRRILTEYVDDAGKKLDVYNDLLVKIELFTEIINSRFQFKKIIANRTYGFLLNDVRGRTLDVASLSSGEQHELVLAYDLIFKTQPGSLILVDEPEISMHIAWQKRFILDLLRIISLSPIDIVVSTHSPQLIGRYIDLSVQLEGPLQ